MTKDEIMEWAAAEWTQARAWRPRDSAAAEEKQWMAASASTTMRLMTTLWAMLEEED